MRTYTKKYIKEYTPVKKYNGLTKQQAYALEKEIYERLKDEKNFPQLIVFNDEKNELYLEHVGLPLSKIQTRKIKVKANNFDLQILNIVEVLRKKKIYNCDISKFNLCYKAGTLYLIDFDNAVIDNTPLSPKIGEAYLNFKKNGGYDTLNHFITNIVSECISN